MIRGQVVLKVPAPLPEGSPVVIATDGSARTYRRNRVTKFSLGFGFLGSDGSYGSGGMVVGVDEIGSDGVGVAELQAIAVAVNQLYQQERHFIVISDSSSALRLIDMWHRGETLLPPGFVGAQHSSIKNLRANIMTRPNLGTYLKVKSHTGFLLNEAADSLASLGRRAMDGKFTKKQHRDRVHALAEGFVCDRRFREGIERSVLAATGSGTTRDE